MWPFVHLVFYFRIKIYIRFQRVIDQLSKRAERNPSNFHFKNSYFFRLLAGNFKCPEMSVKFQNFKLDDRQLSGP
jgi:hypothetical protein